MYKQTNKVIDSVSASELLRALNTLRNMSEKNNQFEISFSKEVPIKLDDFPENSKTVGYEKYMASKSNVKIKKNTQKQHKKTPSPLKEQKSNVQERHSNLKSRSHSPYEKRSQRTDSRISNLSRHPVRPQFPKQSKIKSSNNKKELVCPCFQSKRIIDQRQKSGINYIPIQYRAEELLREKQHKIVKLQKEKQFNKILEEKECTFKPQIKPYKKAKRYTQEPQEHKISEYEKQRFEEYFIDQEFLCTPTHPFNNNQNFQQSLPSPLVKQASESKLTRKYKNEKFNCLLDLIQ